MKSIRERLEETTKERMAARLESYMKSYPSMGYGTYVVQKGYDEDGDKHYVIVSRLTSCD